jgi:hypothetical protein
MEGPDVIRLVIRGAANHQLKFESRFEVRPEKLDAAIARIAAKHANALRTRKLHWIEIEFLDEPDEGKRFFDIPGCSRFWSPREDAYVKATYPTTPTREIAKRLKRPARGVYQIANTLGLRKSAEFRKEGWWGFKKGSTIGEAYRFKKGIVPANKGKKMPGWCPGRMKETQFKKGQRTGAAAKNWKPVGTIVADTDGYLRIKVREPLPGEKPAGWGNPDIWPLYNRYLLGATSRPDPAEAHRGIQGRQAGELRHRQFGTTDDEGEPYPQFDLEQVPSATHRGDSTERSVETKT